MRTCLLFLILVCFVPAPGRGEAGAAPGFWHQEDKYPGEDQSGQPRYYGLFTVRESLLESFLFSLPDHPSEAGVLQLPQPGGGYRAFRVWETPVMEEALSHKYPGIRTFTAAAKDDGQVTAKLDYSPAGFHAMVYDGDSTFFIDPYTDRRDGYYRVYYRKDYERPPDRHMSCGAAGDVAAPLLPGDIRALTHGGQKRSYRLALACTGEYAVAVAGPAPTKAAVLARMVVSLNRVIGIYERELAVTMKLVGNTDTLIFLDGATDPYSNNNGGLMMTENQATVNARIGPGGYDIGHVFSTGGGGIAQIAGVCDNSQKAKGVTGALNPAGDPFDIDYVAHEIGHQFGADHTFNSNIGGCGGGNRTGSSAFEPGSGSTLMAYAGLCGADNIQSHSSTYFHAWSLMQITRFLVTGGICALITPEGNQPPSVPSVAAVHRIPYLTPFELTAPPVPGGNPDLAYCWESWDRSSTELTWAQTRLTGPMFRSFSPVKSPVRVFPETGRLVQNITSYVGEKLPDTSRLIHFRLTARDYSGGLGSFHISDDSVVLQVIRTPAPFEVTSPDRASVSWLGGNTETVTWNVSGTDLPPIGCSRVDIYLSVDGGYSYPFLLKSAVPNTGTAVVAVPNTRSTSAARVKVKSRDNVFFDISDEDFSITHDARRPYPDGITDEDLHPAQLRLFPVPASGILHVETGSDRQFEARIFNAFGQAVWEGVITRSEAVYVGDWVRGIYYLQLTDGERKQRIARSVVVQ